jgi:hypothetical protein
MNLKEKCHILRSQGKSYNTIVKETGVSKSTLSFWFSGTIPGTALISGNPAAAKLNAKERLLAYHAKRKVDLRHKEFANLIAAQKDFERFKKHPLFMAGLMLYAGSGDKANRQLVRLSSSDPLLIVVFVRFMRKYFPIETKDKMKLTILSYEDHHIPTIEGYWLKMTGLQRENLYKTQVIKGRKKTKRLPYGLGNVSISNRIAKVRILEFLRLSIKVLSQ